VNHIAEKEERQTSVGISSNKQKEIAKAKHDLGVHKKSFNPGDLVMLRELLLTR
jgi:hypothetical protein